MTLRRIMIYAILLLFISIIKSYAQTNISLDVPRMIPVSPFYNKYFYTFIYKYYTCHLLNL